MKKTEFMEQLKKGISALPKSEQLDILSYYEEYFLDAGEENEDKVLKELGNPNSIIAQLKAESSLKEVVEKPVSTKKSLSTIWLCALAILASPIAVPLAIALVAVVFAVALTLACILFSLFLIALCLLLMGVIFVIVGIVTLFIHAPSGILMIGIGFASLGLGIAFTIGMITFSRWIFRLLARAMNKLIKRGKRK